MDERIVERKTTIMWKGARCLPLEVGVAERIILSRKEGLSLSGWRARTRGSWHSRSAREEDTFKWYFNTRTRGKVYLRWREAATHAWKPRQRCQSDRSKRWENWRTYSWRITVLEESQPTVKEAEWLCARASAEDGSTGVTVILPALFDVLLCSLIDWFDLLSMKIHNVRLGHFCARLNWGANWLGWKAVPFCELKVYHFILWRVWEHVSV